jgi:hypothetical protein
MFSRRRSQRLASASDALAWFREAYAPRLGRRYESFAVAFAMLLARSGADRTIVETGCIREKDDYSAGYSTVLFGELLRRFGGRLYSVDRDERNVALARRLTKRYAKLVAFAVSDSIAYLQAWPAAQAGRTIDLLYLDSFDYPLRPEDGSPEASQRHCLGELEAALPSLHERSIVLIDDGDLPGGGKPRLAKRRLAELGWTCVIDDYQTLWTPVTSGRT